MFAQVKTELCVMKDNKVAYSIDIDEVDSIIFVDVTDPADNGAISGIFSVDDDKKVRFSKGNLQYQASTSTWKFADNQYDFVGDDTEGNVYTGTKKSNNEDISSTYSGWIDLFCWGTSGWYSGAAAYLPYSVINDNSYYYPGGNPTNSLTRDYANADWGVYNAISNGGNQPGLWRTLTMEEWHYLFTTRPKASILYGAATVNGVYGYVLLPDDWYPPTGLGFTGNPKNWTTNVYNVDQWRDMQNSGAVFLPCAGFGIGPGMASGFNTGLYWSASICTKTAGAVYSVEFLADYLDYMRDGSGRAWGLSVRLVQDVP